MRTFTMMRDPIVSISKGIAIILMVLGHTISTSSAVGAFIYMFHVPLFIFASGYCFKEYYLNDVLTFVKRRIKGLWWPFFKYNCLFLAFHNLFLSAGIYDQTVIQYFTLPQHITKVLHFALMYDSEMLLGAFWFLNTLMGGVILFYTLRLVLSRHAIVIISLLGTFILLSLWDSSVMSRILYATFFYACGNVYSTLRHERLHLWTYTLLFAIATAIGSRLWSGGMTEVTYAQLLPHSLTALCGILMVWNIGYDISKMNATKTISYCLQYVGNHTLPILTWHFLLFKVVSYCLVIGYALPYNQLSDFPVIEDYSFSGWWLVYWGTGVLGSLLIGAITDRGSFMLKKQWGKQSKKRI